MLSRKHLLYLYCCVINIKSLSKSHSQVTIHRWVLWEAKNPNFLQWQLCLQKPSGFTIWNYFHSPVFLPLSLRYKLTKEILYLILYFCSSVIPGLSSSCISPSRVTVSQVNGRLHSYYRASILTWREVRILLEIMINSQKSMWKNWQIM